MLQMFYSINLIYWTKTQDWYTRLGFNITQFKRKLISPADWIFSNKDYSYIQACIADRLARNWIQMSLPYRVHFKNTQNNKYINKSSFYTVNPLWLAFHWVQSFIIHFFFSPQLDERIKQKTTSLPKYYNLLLLL